jgi:hypothetical protein
MRAIPIGLSRVVCIYYLGAALGLHNVQQTDIVVPVNQRLLMSYLSCCCISVIAFKGWNRV